MGALELVLLAVGLSMDACAVAMSNGMCHKELGRRRMLGIGVCFGVMQGIMPLLGYFLGAACSDIISSSLKTGSGTPRPVQTDLMSMTMSSEPWRETISSAQDSIPESLSRPERNMPSQRPLM